MNTTNKAGQRRLVLIISILASFVAFLDGSVVNVALPAIMRQLGGGLALQQWTVDAYLITLGAFILIAGSLSDLLGRKKVLYWGLLSFGITSLLCAISPDGTFLIVMRAFQGVAGALLVPSSLALIISTFPPTSQGRAIGTWTAWTGIAFIIGPLLGGILIVAASWRLIFAINILPILVTLFLLRFIQQEHYTQKKAKIDMFGVLYCAIGLGGTVYALIEQSYYGWLSPRIYIPLLAGLFVFVIFLRHEQKTPYGMLPLKLFKVHNFAVGNIATTAIYGGLSVASFLITIFIQQVDGYSAIKAGLALLPITIIMFMLSPRFGALSSKYGSRLFMGLGPFIGAIGFLTMLQVGRPLHYWTQLFPGILLFGIGLSITVAPLTSAILGAIDSTQAGVGSAINNAVSRIAGLLSVAIIGVVIGSTISIPGFHRGIILVAILLLLGSVVSSIGIRNSIQNQNS